jgi:hypothetical protein
MSNQSEYENQQNETLTPEEMREFLMTVTEATEEDIAQLSDEQLEEIAGGIAGTPYSLRGAWRGGVQGYNGANYSGKDSIQGFFNGVRDGAKNKPGTWAEAVNNKFTWFKNAW